MLRILLVKTSSLGDVIHNLPVVCDIHAHLPGSIVDWVCETPYADLLALHPGVRRAVPISLRHLKKNFFSANAWREFLESKRGIGRKRYDFIIDSQGLLKSAGIAACAHGMRGGYAWDSAREPLASCFYQRRVSVAKNQHAVVRNRKLVAQVLGFPISDEFEYGLRVSNISSPWLQAGRYAVFLHATSRTDKMWPDADWVVLGRRLGAQGLRIVLPWGPEEEKNASARLAVSIPEALVAPSLTLTEAALLLSGAALVVGVDTGLAHLAVALGAPTIGIYGATRTELTGLLGGTHKGKNARTHAESHAVNLGGAGKAPDVEIVWQTAQKLVGGHA